MRLELRAAARWIMLAVMSCRSLCSLLALLGCLSFTGCYDPADNTQSEEKNPYFLEGKARVASRDYRGAMAAFEKALEENPRSALAHFELGVLCEQHGGQNESDYINAMYHYQQAMRFRPNAYPCDNARLRMASCKRELVKAESLAPVYQSMQRELERLKAENQQMRTLLEAWQALGNDRLPGAPAASGPRPAQPRGQAPASSVPPARAGTNFGGAPPFPLMAPAVAPMRTYVVRQGDTPATIARQFRVKLEALVAANPGLNAKRLRTGQTLRIPPS